VFQPQEISREEWDEVSQGSPQLNLLQSWAYGAAKEQSSAWRVERGYFQDNGSTLGIAQCLVRSLPLGLGGVAWVNRGPMVVSSGSAHSCDQLAAALRAYYVSVRGYYLRIAPPVPGEAFNAADWREAGFETADTLGWASAVLDLSPPLEELRAGLNRKWRGHLNRAGRQSIDLKVGDEEQHFDVFLRQHESLIAEKGFETSVTPAFLRALQDALPKSRKMLVVLAYHENELLGSVLMAFYGDTAEYLAGNTTDQGRRLGAGHLMLWRAIEAVQERGYRYLDVSGMDPIQTPEGILTFKQGLNAEPYRFSNNLYAGVGGPITWALHRFVSRAL